MQCYLQHCNHGLFAPLGIYLGLSVSNRWVKLGGGLPWDKIEKEYNKRLKNSRNSSNNKAVRMAVGALIVKHVEKLSVKNTVLAIQGNPYMQYSLGLEKLTEKQAFVPEQFVLIRMGLNHDFFCILTSLMAKADGSMPKKRRPMKTTTTAAGTLKTDGTYSDTEVRYPTAYNL